MTNKVAFKIHLTEYQVVISLKKEDIRFLPILFSWFPYQGHIPIFLNLTMRNKTSSRSFPNASIKEMKKKHLKFQSVVFLNFPNDLFKN